MLSRCSTNELEKNQENKFLIALGCEVYPSDLLLFQPEVFVGMSMKVNHLLFYILNY